LNDLEFNVEDCSLAVFGFQPAGGYHLLRKVQLGAAPGGSEYFDYITFDPAARRAYLSHGLHLVQQSVGFRKALRWKCLVSGIG